MENFMSNHKNALFTEEMLVIGYDFFIYIKTLHYLIKHSIYKGFLYPAKLKHQILASFLIDKIVTKTFYFTPLKMLIVFKRVPKSNKIDGGEDF